MLKIMIKVKSIILKIYCKMFIMIHNAGCHQLADRSFFYKGYQFPMCARCTGVFISSLIAIVVFFFYKLNVPLCIVMCGIMFTDWFMQRINIRPSNNVRRLITGLIGGYGFMTLQLYIYQYIFIWLFLKSTITIVK